MVGSLDRYQQDQKDRDDDSAAVGIKFAFLGVVLGLSATLGSMLAAAFAIAITQGFTGEEACGDGFDATITWGLVAFGVGVSLWIGLTIFRSRKYVGMHSDGPDVDPSDKANARMLRKRFGYSSMIVYCTMAPFSWLYIVAAANCAGN